MVATCACILQMYHQDLLDFLVGTGIILESDIGLLQETPDGSAM